MAITNVYQTRELRKNLDVEATFVARGTATLSTTTHDNVGFEVLGSGDLPDLELLNGRIFLERKSGDTGAGTITPKVAFTMDAPISVVTFLYVGTGIDVAGDVRASYLPDLSNGNDTITAADTEGLPQATTGVTNGMLAHVVGDGDLSSRIELLFTNATANVVAVEIDWFMHLNFRVLGQVVPLGVS
jgi:hypothetical protein